MLRRGFLLAATGSVLAAQVAKKSAGKRPAAGTKPPAAASAKPPVAEAKPTNPNIDPQTQKLLDAVTKKFSEAQNYELQMALDSGRQFEDDPREPLTKADIKFKFSSSGAYSLEVIEEADDKPAYKIISDGTKRWAYVEEKKQYRETPAMPTRPIKAFDAAPDGPLSGKETIAERFVRQLVPLLAGINQLANMAFVRGTVVTVLSKQTENAHGTLVYLTLTSAEGDISKVSWYESAGDDGKRNLIRTDYAITSFKVLPAAPAASEFTFTPPPGTTLSAAAQPPSAGIQSN